MTEGIVQKILSKYRPIRKSNGNYPYFTPKIFLQLQSELISEIKKINDDKHYPSHVPRLILEKQLIGDTE